MLNVHYFNTFYIFFFSEVFTYQPEADSTLSVKKRKHSESSPFEVKDESMVETEEVAKDGETSGVEKKKKNKKKNKNQGQEITEAPPAKKKTKTKEPHSD